MSESHLPSDVLRRVLPVPVKRQVRRLLELPARRRYLRGQRALMAEIRRRYPEREVIEEIVDRRSDGVQRLNVELAQFLYSSDALAQIVPDEILDIGSHRAWIIGVTAAMRVRTVDVRRAEISPRNEVFHEGRAEELPFADASVNCVTSLSSIEHFGLGSYGDEFDPDGDRVAAAEITRILRPGGHLILTTLCTGRPASFVVFNTRRVYSLADVELLFPELELLDRRFFSWRFREFVDEARLQTELAPYAWDMYLSTWRKPDRPR